MKIIFLDTNILRDHALGRPGFYAEARQVIEWCASHADNSFFAYHSFSNLYYVLRSQRDGATAVAYLKGLLSWASVAATSQQQLIDSVAVASGNVEDKLQYQAMPGRLAHQISRQWPGPFSKSQSR